MDAIRLATPAEIDSIKDRADLNAQSTVIAFDRKNAQPDIAVLKTVAELDPVFYAEGTDDRRKALFIWAVENALRLMGVGKYYFNVAASDTQWQKNIESWGAERVSPVPEYRYVRGLQNGH